MPAVKSVPAIPSSKQAERAAPAAALIPSAGGASGSSGGASESAEEAPAGGLWRSVCTTDFKLLTDLLSDAQSHSNVFAVTGEAGTGKSFCLRQYAATHPSAHLLCCSGYWNCRYFLVQLLSALGCDHGGLTVAEMVQRAVVRLKGQRKPLLIFDEADKLSDQVLHFFITLYNELEGHCGMVLCATNHLEQRLHRGLKYNSRGYKELFSRIGRRCIALSGPGFTDVARICRANGVADKRLLRSVFNQCEGDLRRVRRRIHAIKNAG